MAYHEDFLRTVCQSALQHWDRLPLKRSSTSKNVLRTQDFRSYAVLTHVMDVLGQYQRRTRTSRTPPNERDFTELAQNIQVAMVVLGRDRVLRNRAAEDDPKLDDIRDIERVLARLQKETNKEKSLEGNLRRTAGAIVQALGGTSSTKLFPVRTVVEQEGPEELTGSPFRPLYTRRQLEERENGRHVSYAEIQEFALRLLGLPPVTSSSNTSAKDARARIDDAIDPDLPADIRALVEESRRDEKARARYRAKFPSSRVFPLIGDDDVAPMAHQPPKRTRAPSASRKDRKS